MDFPFLQDDEIEAAAEGLLQEAFGSVQDLPFPVDLDVVAYDYLYDRQNVTFRDDRALGSEAGDSILGITRPRQRKIFVDSGVKRNGPVGRYRFTVAHEMGHWILHAPLYSRDVTQGSLFENHEEQDEELVSLQRNVFPKAGRSKLPPEEWQANRFAIALLIDRERLREEFRARFDRAYVTPENLDERATPAGRRKVARRLASEEVGARRSLTDLFGLSTEAMAIALERRGYVRRVEAVL